MRSIYIECNMGAAGDMLLAALTECMDNPDGFVEELNSLQIPGVQYRRIETSKCGIKGTHMEVMVHGEEECSEDVNLSGTVNHHVHEDEDSATHYAEHHAHKHGDSVEGHVEEKHHKHIHHSLQDVCNIIEKLSLPEQVIKDIKSVYQMLAEAEAHVHGTTVTQIHFHEVGNMDAIADITGVCLAMHKLQAEQITVSPVHVGCGQVKCAHGILPVPTPATAYLLQGIPMYGGSINGELCTPTGAALLKYFGKAFGSMPVMQIEKTGYGLGKKDFQIANMIRVMVGETSDAEVMDEIVELCCNLDDMTPEKIGFVTELLMQRGALDVYVTNIQMKKNRPGILLTCMCRSSRRNEFLQLIFKHTTTLGIREYSCVRYGLQRFVRVEHTSLGDVHIKTSEGYGVRREKMEYEDLANIAKEKEDSIEHIQKAIERELNKRGN